jgi:AraC-like DNA-binding protein
MVGRSRWTGAYHLPPHDHQQAWEVCVIEHGLAHWWVEDEVHELPAGSLYITRPHERHGRVDALAAPVTLCWAIIDLGAHRDRAWRTAAAALGRAFRRTCPAGARVPGLLSRILAEQARPDPLAPLVVRGLLLNLLCEVARQAAGDARSSTFRPSPGVRSALALLHAGLDGPLRIADLARAAGLRPTAFHARFRRECGFTPAAYRTRLRMLRAQDLLMAGESVTATAHGLGFPSSQHFATVFRRWVGCTPTAWRTRAALPDGRAKGILDRRFFDFPVARP